jgi:hypothetical protein
MNALINTYSLRKLTVACLLLFIFFTELLVVLSKHAIVSADIFTWKRFVFLNVILITLSFLAYTTYTRTTNRKSEEKKYSDKPWLCKLQNQNIRNLIILIAVFIFTGAMTLNLSSQYMWTDEVFSFHASKMILEKGEPVFESGLDYNRAKAYHYLTAFGMAMFGENEFGSRIFNLIFVAGTSFLIFLFLQKESIVFGTLASVFYLTVNLTVAMARMTRMYHMFVFLFLLSAYSFYKTFIEAENKSQRRSISLSSICWSILFFCSIYLSYQTQPLTVAFLFGIWTYYFLYIIRNKATLRTGSILLILTFFIMFSVKYKFDTFNLWDALFVKTTLSWAQNTPLNPKYYYILATNNIVSFFSLIIFGMVSMLIKRKNKHLFLCSVFISGLFLISFQKQLQERYICYLIPVIVIIIFIALQNLYELTSDSRLLKSIFIFVLVFFASVHGARYVKEMFEIDKYDRQSIFVHKKLEFNDVFDNLKQKDLKKYKLVADWHSAFTLKEKGFNVNFILLPEFSEKIKEDICDQYFHIPYLVYESEKFKSIFSEEKVLLVVRDDQYPGLETKYIRRIEQFSRPKVYEN